MPIKIITDSGSDLPLDVVLSCMGTVMGTYAGEDGIGIAF